MTRTESGTPADVWILLRERPAGPVRSTQALLDALTETYGSRFAVWHTDELLMGVTGGRLVLRTLGGVDVPPPRVVLVRQVPGTMSGNREITLLRHLELLGAAVVNPPDAHRRCGNKMEQLQHLALAGLPVPDSLSYATAPLAGVVRAPGVPMPCVVKSGSGMGGEQVFLAADGALLSAVAGSLAQDVPWVLQEYVTHSHGRDLRVVVVDGRAVAAQIRTSADGSLTANLARGGTSEVCTGRYPRAESLAVAAARALGLSIAGVDLLFGPAERPVVCEVNAVPGFLAYTSRVVTAILEYAESLLTDAS
ncbi:ATP-grasp domain-containing protein [Streptomyces yaizuensis]|uniref:RimK family alpha-L-glutamate ligase n=1 Tax=Streptomyces yaizuensis TaxID=2989713 RepID=A0ABQ5P9D8_9ACTN|nr:RimK family alpha-L-glutamate ligase [Streptomyces sp. YSPA8]GLF99208.1 RimK family alpha-L-glutamate ligase [Streptomyces sp. YSPA8]